MYVEELAAKHLDKFLKTMDRASLRVYIYNLRIPSKTKKRLSNLLFNVLSNIRLIDWIISQIDLDLPVDVNLMRVLTYRFVIERNTEVINRWVQKVGESLLCLFESRDKILKKIQTLKPLKRLAIMYSYPEFFVRRLMKYLRYEELCDVLESMNHRLPYTWLCINSVRYDRDDVISLLESEGFRVHPDEDFYDIIRVEKKPKRIEKSIAYRRKMFIIAEKASIACTHLLQPSDGDTILDMCAAPGIKLLCTAFKMNDGKIIAVDISRSRMQRLMKIVRKYDIHKYIRLETKIIDARKLSPSNIETVDKIIVDAECSSTGLISKSPDIKLRITSSKINELSTLQKQLLSKALKLGEELGAKYIVYSVCSLLPEEGEFVILNIKNTKYRISDLSVASPAYVAETGRRFFPHIHKTIGFFISRFEQ